MFFAIDVGNTNIKIGIFDGKNLITTFRMNSQIVHTTDEYGLMLKQIPEVQGIDLTKIEGAIISSVVPKVMESLHNAIVKYFGIKPIIVGPGIKTGIKLTSSNPKEVGADRLVDVVSGYEKYGGPLLVIDFGTATTYNLVTADGSFSVGITAPGVKISAKALWEDAAKLPEIEIKKPSSILATETVTSMQAGLIYGQIGATKYIIEQVKKEMGYDNLKVVATGGMGSIISPEVEEIDYYDINLTIDGLRILYEKNTK
ncbi:MAG: type III pantothenate kinase [Lachnospiraceae bacterium]|jgi:type III pantothenate kinase|nr:type III pantothenate kinase [Lachnospiraceae bacterium]MCI6330605.1 type III pantothenate kinase [Lachnospiraceae bacterium]MCI6409376.1 type III pantothenate kinase [Lachnospiraceae bacterium]MCI6664787.1 type III pantothenate kinase [Lachnospiraceae bacterium]MCI6978911.1 type III pantothenate kinase [Lachnospiraceae bacterium]